MSDAQQEPSMEEILASIRRIISEDADEAEAPPAAAAEEAPMELSDEIEEMAEEEPMTLDDALPDDPMPEDPMTDEAMADEAMEDPMVAADDMMDEELPEEDPIDQTEIDSMLGSSEEEDDMMDDLPEMDDEPMMPAAASVPAPSMDDRIISTATESLGIHAFAALEKSVRMGQVGDTLEDIIKGLLKPMLRQWLDTNLPGLVERLVEQEIQKIASGARRHARDDDF